MIVTARKPKRRTKAQADATGILSEPNRLADALPFVLHRSSHLEFALSVSTRDEVFILSHLLGWMFAGGRRRSPQRRSPAAPAWRSAAAWRPRPWAPPSSD